MWFFALILTGLFAFQAHSQTVTPEISALLNEALGKIRQREVKQQGYVDDLENIRRNVQQQRAKMLSERPEATRQSLMARIEITPTWLSWARDNRKGQYDDYLIKYDILTTSHNDDIISFFQEKIRNGWFVEQSETNVERLSVPIKEPVTMKVRLFKPTY
jgi:hypothetical protein